MSLESRGGMMLTGENGITRRETDPVPLLPSQIPNELTRSRTWAFVLWDRRLTAWATARLRAVSGYKRIKVSYISIPTSGSQPVVREPLGGSQNLPGCSREDFNNGVFFVRILIRRWIILCHLPQKMFQKRLLLLSVFWPVKLMFNFHIYVVFCKTKIKHTVTKKNLAIMDAEIIG
jgi:hypothetical protein